MVRITDIDEAQQEVDEAICELERLLEDLEDHYEAASAAEADRDESWHHWSSGGPRPCPCGSGQNSWWEKDARGIPPAPNWIADGRNCDGESVPELVSDGRGLYGDLRREAQEAVA